MKGEKIKNLVKLNKSKTEKKLKKEKEKKILFNIR